MRRAAVLLSIVAIGSIVDDRAGAQAPQVFSDEADVEEESAQPGLASPTPKVLTRGGDLPPIPRDPPDRFAVMAFENRTPVRAMDWTTAGIPLTLAEKVEQAIGLVPAYDAWVIPEGRAVPVSPAAVAAFAIARNARWIFTGWVERPNWELRLAIALWKVEGGVATRIGEVESTRKFEEVHAMTGDAVAALAATAGWSIDEEARAELGVKVTRDLYALTLIGRGLAHLRGTVSAANLKLAEHDLERAIFIEPTLPVGQRLAGQLLLDYPKDPQDPKAVARSTAKAAGKFAYAADLAPKYLPAVIAAAAAARRASKPDIARDLYDRIVRARPWDLDARVYLGEALWQTGDGEAALRELERVVERSPDDLRARRLIALVHSDRGELDQLVDALEEIAQRAPDDLEVRLDLGAAYAALDRWDDARATYLEVAALRPDDPQVLKLVGDVEQKRGDADAAAAWYFKMEKAAPDDPRPPFLIGQAWLSAGRLDRAHKALIRTQKHREYLGEAYAALGAVQYLLGKHDEALWYLKRATQKRPHSAAARVAVARVLLYKRFGAQALTQVAAARTLGGEGAELDYLAAIGNAQIGDLAAAKKSVAAALSRSPGMPEAKRAQEAIDRGAVPEIEGAPAIDLPFGDIDAFEDAIDRFLAAEAAMQRVRKTLDDNFLKGLAALAEGPGKDLSKEARKRARPRSCPLAQVARPYAIARRLEKELYRRGLVLEEAYRRVDALDDLGEGVGLTPDYRRKIAEVRRGWRRARVGVREVRSELTVGLGRELKARHCSEPLLAAAAARPDLYGAPKKVGVAAPVKQAARPPAKGTIYIDNRECTDAIELWIDGEPIGEAPGGQRSAFDAAVGQRLLCLLVPGESGACGDRGTVRQAYLHDGWSTIVHCRGRRRRDIDALPGKGGMGTEKADGQPSTVDSQDPETGP